MININLQKNKIKQALQNRQAKIPVFFYNAHELFNAVLKENPTIAKTVAETSYSGAMVGGFFTVKYKEKVVSTDGTLYADTAAQVEEIMHRTIRNFEGSVVVSVVTDVDVKAVFNDFFTAYQGYYSNLVGMEYVQHSWTGRKYKVAQFTFKYRIGRVMLSMMEIEVNKKIEELGRTLFCAGMSPEVKAFIAHNYLSKTVTYWRDEKANPLEKSYMQSAYGALINKKCVCQGYAEAYKRILNSQGITCEVICGQIKGSPTHHAWNIISFNKRDYYHVDVTWDAPQRGADRYKYYGLRDANLSAERTWERPSDITYNSRENILATAKSQLSLNGKTYIARGVDREYFN